MKPPYPMVAAVDLATRHAQIRAAVAIANERGYVRLTQHRPGRRILTIACYGPSLQATWRQLRRPILSMSGATHFLNERGIVPDMHVDMDPRLHKVQHLQPLVPNVHYLMASVCPLATWELLAPLERRHVTLWHSYSGKDDTGYDTHQLVKEIDPGALVIHGGSTIGLSAVHVGRALGFNTFEIHGMDGSFADGRRHAGPHYGHGQSDSFTWAAEGVKYRTSQIMANAVAETLNMCQHWPGSYIFHGAGLTQALVRELNVPNACTAGQEEKAEGLRARRVVAPIAPLTWDVILGTPDPQWLADLQVIWAQAETRRARAAFNTGSIPLETGLQLRALSAWKSPQVIVEVGTFIGKSTLALQAERIYTCDKDNDCLPATPRIVTHPKTASTTMLRQLAAQQVRADLFFFDGRLTDEDIDLVLQCSAPGAVYAFDDDHAGPTGKGAANVAKLQPRLTNYLYLPPAERFAGRSTLSVLVPVPAAT